ncbi:MAG TPA: DUF930 domain-containing protein [Pseudolabrys sp.]|nr:DUF930 domain-containing protein [Pseudolabrys sp.]
MLATAFLISLAAPNAAIAEAKLERTLKLLMPTDRMAQLCDATAMSRIRKDMGKFRPDRAVANATIDIVIAGNSLEAKGAAFRSHGKWYALTYSCLTNDDHLKVLSFDYKIGEEIPQEKWAGYGLWQ